jgi:hypothetical protein
MRDDPEAPFSRANAMLLACSPEHVERLRREPAAASADVRAAQPR